MLFIETIILNHLTSLCLNFPIYNRDARVSTSRALWWFWWSDYKALCLGHSNVVSYHYCNYLPETRWLKTIAMYHLTACTSQKSRHSQAPWVLPEDLTKPKSKCWLQWVLTWRPWDRIHSQALSGGWKNSGPCVTVGLRSPLAGAPSAPKSHLEISPTQSPTFAFLLYF